MITPSKKLQDLYVIENALLANSITVAVGDAVIINTGTPSTVTGAANMTGIILGTVVAIKNGAPSGNVFLQETTVTTASNNTTSAQISVDILPSTSVTTYVADLSAVSGTTTNSQYFGYFNLSASLNGTLNEASYSASAEKQFLSYGVNPGNTSQVIGVWTKIAQA
jgi:hypothetical protein